MAYKQFLVEEWLLQNQNEMIHCPYQPGNLFILKNAFINRHKLSRIGKDILQEGVDEVYYQFKRGLLLCRQCSIGEKFANSDKMN
jgi:hypothetical protein